MKKLLLLTCCIFCHEQALANIEKITVYGHRTGLIGESISASSGIIGQGEIEDRPMLRSTEMLELIPGMAVTQHSGSGKANQYFIRGFNLDHGTDFATNIDGMPINMRSHGHGQGYTDLNFIIPETIATVSYKKGSYDASQGDFSAAGSAYFNLADNPKHQQLDFTLGEDSYLRGVALGYTNVGQGKLIGAVEWQGYDGPWQDIDEDVNKKNALLRYAGSLAGGDLSITAMAYDNQWNSADQIPQRAVDQGIISQLGSLDKTLGGSSSRYSLSTNWQGRNLSANAYVIDYDLSLYSNFSYFLNDPINGDQFRQRDSRTISGAALSYQFAQQISQIPVTHTVGLDLRNDNIDKVGLYNTQAREYLSTVREDDISETSYSAYWQSVLSLTERLEATLGARYDYLDAQVSGDNRLNSGDADDDLVSFKASLSYVFTDNLAGYANWGQSFHSNDARGATITLDPVSLAPTDKVDLLVQSEGGELGVRYFDEKRFNISAAMWWLQLDSELLFVGDAGNTEASDASNRYGLEVSAYYWLDEAVSLDAEASFTHSRLDISGDNDRVEGAVPVVASAGINWHLNEQWQSSVRIRHIGKRTLNDDGSKRSEPLTVVNGLLSYQQTHWKVGLELLNMFDSTDHDIDYYYASRLAGEPNEGVEDNHFHPIEPRTIRLNVSLLF
ncbi:MULTISPECIES: TonB-dependent receptor [unclassified Pseudoalteromonas]|uniref:TonB-dependent receptor n=1 Tax=unclassified Pseudoalteromonas TaxID=194690 RepID=UPI000C07CB40|nr:MULTISPECIES: TonB-dependent receptor [unclassified Pseudoalteromonas]MDP2636888.1 TonB-dependent receptor [Pseudoalteromonas sp. 1_MG-2023]PHN88115.1 TonB-dependent receptor [Pseudoalteromonas sp. 3D05]